MQQHTPPSGPVEIVPADSPRRRKAFLRLPWTLYRDDPYWVAPLLIELRHLFNPRKNPFLEYGEIHPFLAERDGRIVGRVAAIVNGSYNRHHNVNHGFFGFFECINDTTVSRALFDRVRDWFAQRDVHTIYGPMNPSINHECGLLVDGFDSSPVVMMAYNPRYYVDLYDKGYDGLGYTYPNYGYTDIYKPEELHHLRACYAGEVTLVDRWLGQLLRQAELMGLLDNTSIVLTSDHGMYIGDHDRAGKHTVDPDDPWPLYDAVAKVPLLVRTPFDAPKTIDALVQCADIMPTVLDLCDVAAPATVGKSWVPLLRGAAPACHEAVYTSCHSGDGPGRIDYLPSHITVNDERYTAVFGRPPHKPELYERATDPGQIYDVAEANEDVVATLRIGLVKFMRQQGAAEDYVRTYAMGEAGG